jgi:hypothetical protein
MNVKIFLKLVLIGSLCFALVGCSTSQEELYSKKQPPLIVQHYFNGTVKAYGMVQNRSNEVSRRFAVVITGNWPNAKQGTLHEEFIFDDGEKQTRDWVFTFTDEHHFIGTAADIVGEAHGSQYGNSIHMNYVLAVKTNGKTIDLSVDDWLYAMNDQIVLNKSTLNKFGITFGHITIAFVK